MFSEKYKKYNGWTVVGFTHDTDSNPTEGLVLDSPDKKNRVVLWVLSDSEGNGPGWLEAQEIPVKKKKLRPKVA